MFAPVFLRRSCGGCGGSSQVLENKGAAVVRQCFASVSLRRCATVPQALDFIVRQCCGGSLSPTGRVWVPRKRGPHHPARREAGVTAEAPAAPSPGRADAGDCDRVEAPRQQELDGVRSALAVAAERHALSPVNPSYRGSGHGRGDGLPTRRRPPRPRRQPGQGDPLPCWGGLRRRWRPNPYFPAPRRSGVPARRGAS